MPPPPPRSTLFPYTTLFRSAGRPLSAATQTRTENFIIQYEPQACTAAPLALLAWPDAKMCSSTFLVKDRKSTRLNSSHRTISYAVFCLKKKKQQNTIAQRQQ